MPVDIQTLATDRAHTAQGIAGDSISRLPESVCLLARTEPEAFFSGLAWEVEDDLASVSDFARGTAPAEPFHCSGWLGAALAVSPDSLDVRVLRATFGGVPVAIVPFCLRSGRFARTAEFIAQGFSDYNQPILHPGLESAISGPFLSALLREAGKNLADADRITLTKLPFQPVGMTGGFLHGREPEGAHWTAVKDDWSQAENRYFGKSSRRSLGRKEKKLASFGEPGIRRIDDRQARIGAMRQLAKWKDAQLRALGAANPFRRSALGAFLERIAADPDTERFRIYGMHAGESMVAVTFMICDPARWLLYQTAYTDQEPGRYSPGLILLRHILCEAHDASVPVFDFGLGDEGYKAKYCENSIDLCWAEMPLTPLGRILCPVSAASRRFRGFVKSNAVARRVALAMLYRFDGLHGLRRRT